MTHDEPAAPKPHPDDNGDDAWLDPSAPVRQGERLDEARLSAWLRDALPDLEGPLRVEQFPGGHSNLTYLLHVGPHPLILRRPPFGARIQSAHDMGREFRVLSGLHKVYDKAPRPLAHCDDPDVLGAPFYVMERIQGIILRQDPPEGLLLTPGLMGTLSRSLVDGLVELHQVDLEAAGLQDLGRPQGYVQRQIKGWTRRYQSAQTEELPDMERAARWLAEHMPTASPGATLIHNDYKYDNLVYAPQALEQGRIIGVLDWEMATVGDPLMDLGTSLAYWVDPDDPPALRKLPFGPNSLPGNLRRLEVAGRYASASGRSLADVLFYYVYALFKVAVILQQIYARYQQGHTSDPRFKAMAVGVKLLARQACLALDKGRIDRLGGGG